MSTITEISSSDFEVGRSSVDPAEFPVGGTTSDVLRFVLRYAVLAPSTYNHQPWQFDVDDTHLDVYLDESRGLAVVDPDDREAVVSCGAAVLNIRLALAYFGYWTAVRLLPDPAEPALLARVAFDRSVTMTDDDRRLFAQITRRYTNRGPFDDRPVPRELLDRLGVDAAREYVWVHAATDHRDKAALAELIAKGDREQLGDRRFRREVAAWLRTNRSHRRDGIRGHALGASELMSVAEPVVVRTFDLGKGEAARDEQLAAGSPALVVLGTEHDDRLAWLYTGQALQRVLLRCRAHDVWASFLNQPIEVAALRPELAALVGRLGYPQALLRLGYGRDPGPEPRRPVDDVVIRRRGPKVP
jgi:hypothetical protein